jgi:octanoyl-[GcvH]:protein N-octanoyltransferase
LAEDKIVRKSIGNLSFSLEPVTRVNLIRDAVTHDTALDTAISRAILERVAAGELPATLRLARPGAMVAFGKQDAVAAGFPAAMLAAREAGFDAVLRLAGGRAAVFHEDTIALAHAVPDPAPREGIHARFEATAGLIARALAGLGVDARVGEVPGEYCPGGFSVNAAGRRKLAGIGQRLIAGASHMGGVIVVGGADRVREVLVPVYGALGLDWDPATTGAVADEREGIGWETVRDAVLAEYAARYELVEAELDEQTLALARRLAPEHRQARAASAASPTSS